MQHYTCDVAVIGGGMGGVAAALAAAESGAIVVLTEATDWLGGQITSQGTSALDEHPHIEHFGGTQTYYRMREAIRAHYCDCYGVPPTMPTGEPLNPGNGWVSRLCFEPAVGLHVLETMLQPHVIAQRLTILLRHTPIAATVEDDRVLEVTVQSSDGTTVQLHAAFVLDATELGDLLALTGTAYVTGAESQAQTGEAHAKAGDPQPNEVQGCTFCFAVEHRAGEDHTIAKPHGYEQMRDQQPFSLTLRGNAGEDRPFRVFGEGPTGLPSFWTYRRIRDGGLLDPSGATRDIALINWPGNDFHDANLIDVPVDEQQRILQAAKRLALGFLYWLQTEAPHDDDHGRGYPGLRIVPEVMGTVDGLSKAPYIRESRRIVGLRRIVESDIAAEGRTGARAASFDDSVGIGWYHIDLHDCVGNPQSMYAPTRPFQIPLGALIPCRLPNMLAAGKNIGTTHITNGAYRLHPVEWNIGEAAGAFAAFCCTHAAEPHSVWHDTVLLRHFQRTLLERGMPLVWTIDLPVNDPLFVPIQLLLLHQPIPADSPRYDSLALKLNDSISIHEAVAFVHAAQTLSNPAQPLDRPQSRTPDATKATRTDVARLLASVGVNSASLSEYPTLHELCVALVPHIKQATDLPIDE